MLEVARGFTNPYYRALALLTLVRSAEGVDFTEEVLTEALEAVKEVRDEGARLQLFQYWMQLRGGTNG